MVTVQQLLSDEVGGILALGLGAGFTLWKLYLRVRKDKRDDIGGYETHNGYSRLLDEIQEVSNVQGALIIKQGQRIEELGGKLDAEIGKRRLAEDDNAHLRRRVALLEDVVRQLGGTVS